MDILTAIHSPKIFKPLFRDLGTWANWIVCLKSIFALPMTATERQIYRNFTGRNNPPASQTSEAFLIVGRRGGKSFISALIIVFLACFKQWNLGLEKGYIMCIATDKLQASVVLDYVRKILELPVFRTMVIAVRAEEIELSNNMVISVHTCSYRSLRGFTICACVLDELAFWRHEGSNPSKEILTALRPSLGGVRGSLLLAISTGYSQTGPLYEAFRDRYGKDDSECLVWKAGTQDMNPTYNKRVIEEALQDDFSAARAEYFGEFRADLETFLSTELIEAAVVPDRFELPSVYTGKYFAFCDPSGGRGDAMTLSICHIEDSKIVQDCLRVKRPPFNPGACVEEFSKVLRDYGLHSVEGDKYGIGFVISLFEKEGIFYEPSALSKSDVFLESLPLFMQGRVELLDHKQQKNELRSLERRTGKQKDSVDHPRGLHDDAANALCGSLTMAARTSGIRLPPPSLGVSKPIESEQTRMKREVQSWLLDSPGKMKKPVSFDDEILAEQEAEDASIRQEIAAEQGGKRKIYDVKIREWGSDK